MLALDRGVYVIGLLIVDEPIDVVPTREAFNLVSPVLLDAPGEIVGHPNVQPTSLAAEDVDVVLMRARHTHGSTMVMCMNRQLGVQFSGA